MAQVAGLQVDDNIDFQRRSWRIQRVGWVVMLAVVAAALAGALGSGPLSHRRAGSADTVGVEYLRFSRYQTQENLSVHLSPRATRSETVRVWFDRGYLDGMKIDSVMPLPARLDAAGDRLVYEFRVSKPGDAMTITFLMEPQRLGSIAGRLGAGDASPVTFRQFVYP
jgi:hypothetical protein